MQNLIPHFILEQYAKSEDGQPLFGSFEAVSLFVDLSGFSAVTNTLMEHGNEAAEAMADVMLTIFEPLVEQIYAHKGFITTFAGDAFTALFPKLDFAEEVESYHHALAAAVKIQQYLTAHSIQPTPYGSFPFTIKLGLADGEACWGILSSGTDNIDEDKVTYYFNGTAIDAAAKAESYARSGNLILNNSVEAQVKSLIKTIAVGEDSGYVRMVAVDGTLPTAFQIERSIDYVEYETALIPSAIQKFTTHGEFRQVVSVFVNLMGIDTNEELAVFMKSVFTLQEQYGGYLGRIDFGDKGCNLLMFWGAPTSYEQDIERALGFAVDLGNNTTCTYKAGITYKAMYAGLAGSPLRGEYTCYGGGVSFAARLMVAAPWGSIWVDKQIYERAHRQFAIEYEGHFPFRGFPEDKPVYTLLDRKREDAEDFYNGQLVGRQSELKTLTEFVQPILNPESEKRFAGAAVIWGEPGMGKSRLWIEQKEVK